jgi:sporulation protein YlmC with PRC-barrel domain
MNKLIMIAALALLAGSASYAQQTAPSSARLMDTLPAGAGTVNNYSKHSVYDQSDNVVGEIADVLIGPDGRVSAFIVGVGGFLGLAEKHVAVPFDAIKAQKQGNNLYLVMNTSKEALQAARGYEYDRSTAQWTPGKS